MQNKPYTEITTKNRLLELNLKEVYRYRDLLVLFIRRDFVAVYKQTILGPLWFIIEPIFSSTIYYFVINVAAGVDTGTVPSFLFNLAGLTVWNYFSTCLTSTSNIFISNAGIFGKVYFPRLITPLSIVISNLLKFSIQFVLFLFFYVYYYSKGADITINTNIILLPVLLILMAGLGLGLGLTISALTTKYRDLTYLLRFGIQLFMYATPIIYPITMIPSELRYLVKLNPMTGIVETFKTAFFGNNEVEWSMLLYSFSFMVVMLILGMIIFNRTEKNFMDTV